MRPVLIFLIWVGQPYFWGGVKWEWGLTLNPMEKFEHHILNSYNSKIIKDIDMASSDAYIECYGQYVMVH